MILRKHVNEACRHFKGQKYSDFIPILDSFEDENTGEHKGYILEGGYLANTFLCPSLTGASNKLLTSLDSLFKRAYKENTFLQISLLATDDLTEHLKAYQSIRGGRMRFPSVLDMDSQAEYMMKFYQALSQKSLPGKNMEGVPLRNFEVWISFKSPIKHQIPTQAEIEEFNEEIEQLQETLTQLMGYAVPMNPEILVNRLQMLHNPSRKAVWRKGMVAQKTQGCYRPTQLIRKQLIENSTEIDVKESSLVFRNHDGAERHVKSVSIQEYSDHINFGQVHEIVVDWLHGNSSLQGNFMITLNIEFASKKIEKEYSKRRVIAKQLGEGPWARWISSLKYGVQDFEYYEHYLETEKAQHCRCHLNFQVFADTNKKVEKITRNLISRIEAQNWKSIPDRNIGLFTWLNALPMVVNTEYADFVERFDNVPSNLLKFFVPMMASWQGNAIKSPALCYIGRDGQLMNFDPFISDSNYNMFITATSGAGKSFTANTIIEAFLSTGKEKIHEPLNATNRRKPLDGGRVFCIDSGRSYIKLVELLSGQFVEVMPDESFKFNLCPFKTIEERFIYEDLIDDNETMPVSEVGVEELKSKDPIQSRASIGPQGEMLLNILKLMAFPMGDCSSYQVSQMSVIMCELWRVNGNQASIDLFADACKMHDNDEVKRISDQLTPWCRSRNGQHSWMFNQKKPPIQFERDLVVLELDGLNGSDQVKAVCIMLCIQRIQQEMFRHDQIHIQRAFFLDEAWEYLKSNDSMDNQTKEVMAVLAKFLESGWRRFRKYNSLGVCISQALRDSSESAAGQAMANNSAHLLYLMQSPVELELMRKEGKLDDMEYQLLSGVKTVRPHFSEVMIQSGGAKEIGRLYAPRAKALSYSTAPDEKEKIAHYQAKGLPLWEACCAVAEDEGRNLVSDWEKELENEEKEQELS